MEKIQQLSEFLSRLSSGEEPAELKNIYKEVLSLSDQTDLALAHQSILESGMPTIEFCRLCDKLSDFMGDQVMQFRINLPLSHPIQKIFFQHKRFLRILEEIENLNSAIPNLHPAWTGCPEYKRLRNLGADINWIEMHTQAEQNVLMPEIERYGNPSLTHLIKFQHIDLEESYKRLRSLITNLNEIDFDRARSHFNSIVQWLAPVGRMHIVVEENVFYPIANNLIKSKAAWDRFFTVCPAD